jgi:hypothetical protein
MSINSASMAALWAISSSSVLTTGLPLQERHSDTTNAETQHDGGDIH